MYNWPKPQVGKVYFPLTFILISLKKYIISCSSYIFKNHDFPTKPPKFLISENPFGVVTWRCPHVARVKNDYFSLWYVWDMFVLIWYACPYWISGYGYIVQNEVFVQPILTFKQPPKYLLWYLFRRSHFPFCNTRRKRKITRPLFVCFR